MNIIIPMAGRGTRLRPHTLTTPKPLLPVAGKPIVERLVGDIVAVCKEKIDTIAYVVGDFGRETEQNLVAVAERLGANGKIFYQEEALGTAHAIQMAQECLEGEVIIAFADTLFRADFALDRSADGVIWVKQVPNPQSFGVVTLDDEQMISGMVEKPVEFVSDLAIIGIYYIRDGARLLREIQFLLDNNITGKGEYQLTDALENMRTKGMRFRAGEVLDWMDCGNKENILYTNCRLLAYDHQEEKPLVSPTARISDSTIIPPCYIGPNVQIERSIVGPYVSLGAGAQVRNSVVTNTVAQDQSRIENAVVTDTMLGRMAVIRKQPIDVNLGDYSQC